jgi:hypothetical protein
MLLKTVLFAVKMESKGGINMSIPRPEHPNPQWERQNWRNLNGEWEFDFDFGEIENPSDELVEAYDTQRRDMAALYNRYAYIQHPTSYICQKFREAIAKAKHDCDAIINPTNE